MPEVFRMPPGVTAVARLTESALTLEQCSAFDWQLSGRCFNDEGHDKDCNRDSATEVSNVRVESFHAASEGRLSLMFFSLADG